MDRGESQNSADQSCLSIQCFQFHYTIFIIEQIVPIFCIILQEELEDLVEVYTTVITQKRFA